MSATERNGRFNITGRLAISLVGVGGELAKFMAVTVGTPDGIPEAGGLADTVEVVGT